MTNKYQRFYKIIITTDTGTEINSVVFKGYPPVEAITIGMELYHGVKWEVEELDDYDEN